MNTMQAVRQGNDVLSESIILVKNMLRISISSICHVRELFQSECFSKTRYGDAYIYQLKHSSDNAGNISGNESSIKLCQWLEDGVFQAIDDGFLESLSFAIYVKDQSGKETVIENYTFKITQTKLPCGSDIIAINQVPLISREDMKSQAKQYIRQLTQFAATLDELPAERYVTMQLCYNEEAPHAYEPLYFRGSLYDKLAIKVEDGNKAINMNIGEIKTNAASMQVEFNGIEDLTRFNCQQHSRNPMNEGDKEKVRFNSFSSVKNLIIKNGRVTLNECSKVLSLNIDSVLAAMDHMMKDGLITHVAGFYCLNATPKRSQPNILHIKDYDITPVQDSIEDFEDTQKSAKKREFEDFSKIKVDPKKKKIQPEIGQLKLEKKEIKKQQIVKSERCSITKDAIVLKRNRNDGVINCSQQSEI